MNQTKEQMELTRAIARPPSKGAPENFVGEVSVQPLFGANPNRHVSAGAVTFAPGARSAWHTHPAGQTLVVTAGTGWVQEWGGLKLEVKQGDVLWTPPGVKHWHGATSSESMTHIALQEAVDGKVVEWMEPVRQEEYER